MKKNFLILLILILPSLAHSITFNPTYSKLRKELIKDLVQWNKTQKEGPKRINEWADRLTTLLKSSCGETDGKLNYSIDVSAMEIANGISLTPIFIDHEKQDEQTDLSLFIFDEMTSENTEKVESIKCTNGQRYNYTKMIIRIYSVPEVLNPFDTSKELQTARTKTIAFPEEASGQSDVCVIKDMNGTNAPSSTQGFQIIGEERAVSKFLKVSTGGVCTLFDHQMGSCRANDFGNAGGNRIIYNIDTLTDSELELSYEADSLLETGNYIYVGDGVKKVNNKLEISEEKLYKLKPANYSNDKYWRINYDSSTTIEQKIEDFNKYAIINSIDFSDVVITANLVEKIKLINLPKLKQIVLSNWEQLNDNLVINILSQKLVGLEEIKIERTDKFPGRPGKKSKLIISTIEKIETSLPFLTIITPTIPIAEGELFTFNVGNIGNVRNGISFLVDTKNTHDNFSGCLNLTKSTGKNDLSCNLKNAQMGETYNISITKTSSDKMTVIPTTRSFKGEIPKCIEWLYNERTAAPCEPLQFSRGKGEVCGVALYKQSSGAACGVSSYNSSRGEVCGVERYYEGKGRECGDYDGQYRSLITNPMDRAYAGGEYVDNICKATGFDGASAVDVQDYSPQESRYRINFLCVRFKTCRHPVFGVELWRQCEHANFGIKTYNTCRHPSFGAESYNECEHASFGVKTYKTCRDKSFGNEKCLIFADN
ncbi:MAG: hypothetical protein HQK51_06465 [Oligoflexia bacterium]|nr:hypothetical protein [Oligoflexia bacterium]